MIVREANKAEYNTIAFFFFFFASETEEISLDRIIVEKGVKAVLADESKGRYYVAEIEGRIVGSLLTTYEWSDWRNGTVLWIQSVFVLPEFRRKGIYRSMYSYLKSLVIENDKLKGIRLYADKSNKTAHKTYRKLGMIDDHYITFEWLK